MAPVTLFDHPYNRTIHNERAIEIPLARAFIDGHADVLEVGNVLGHYQPATWTVVDKYERAPGVINQDVLDIVGWFDRIVTISTIEHVGWDEPERDPTKPARAIAHLRSLLNLGGALMVTIPTGWNAPLDAQLPSLCDDATFYAKTGATWAPAPFAPLPYDHEGQSATGLWVGEWHA